MDMKKVATNKMIRFSKLIEAVTGFKAPDTKDQSEIVAYIDRYRQVYYDIVNDSYQCSKAVNSKKDY